MAGSLFYLGAYSSLSRYYFDHADAAGRRDVAGAAILLTLAGAAAQMLTIGLAARPLANVILGSSSYATVLVAALGGSALTFVNQIFLLVLRLERRSTTVVVANLAALLLTAGAVLTLVFLWHWGVMGALVGTIIGQAAVTPVLAWLARGALVWRVSRADLTRHLAFGLPAVVIGFGYYALDQSDRMVLKYATAPDLTPVAVYSAGYQVGRVVQALFVQPFAQIWNPMRLEYRNHEEASRLSALVLTYYTLAGLALVVAISLFANEIISVAARRAEYAGAARVIPIVMFAHLVYGTVNIIDTGILVTNRLGMYIALLWAALSVNVALNFLFVPRFGYMGSAWATLISYALLVVAIFVASNRSIPVLLEPRRLISAIVAAVIAIVAGRLFPVRGLAAMAWQAALLIGVLAYFVFGVLDAQERGWLRNGLGRVSRLWKSHPV